MSWKGVMQSFFMGACGARNILISFHSEQGRFLARVQGPVSGNVLLRRQQYRTADGMLSSAVIARNIILAKLANGRNVLMRANRELSAPILCSYRHLNSFPN